MVKRNIDINAPLTEEQKAMLDRSASMPIVFDEDCPELTEAELLEFKRVADVRRESRRKQTMDKDIDTFMRQNAIEFESKHWCST